jgi:hypothetical protein
MRNGLNREYRDVFDEITAQTFIVAYTLLKSMSSGYLWFRGRVVYWTRGTIKICCSGS